MVPLNVFHTGAIAASKISNLEVHTLHKNNEIFP